MSDLYPIYSYSKAESGNGYNELFYDMIDLCESMGGAISMTQEQMEAELNRRAMRESEKRLAFVYVYSYRVLDGLGKKGREGVRLIRKGLCDNYKRSINF